MDDHIRDKPPTHGSDVFENLSWAHLAILAAVGLLVFGPERLPTVIRSSAATLHRLRSQLSKAQAELRDHIGPELDELREPLAELQRLRGMTAHGAITRHLLSDDPSSTGVDQPATTPSVTPHHDATSPGFAPRPTAGAYDREAT